MAPPLLPDRGRPVNRRRDSSRRPEDELQAEDDEEGFEDAEEGFLGHAVEESAPEPRAADHDHADVVEPTLAAAPRISQPAMSCMTR
jgi:hypothetical protein